MLYVSKNVIPANAGIQGDPRIPARYEYHSGGRKDDKKEMAS